MGWNQAALCPDLAPGGHCDKAARVCNGALTPPLHASYKTTLVMSAGFPQSEKRVFGAVAQLGERLVRNEEASGSIPLSSTIPSGMTEPKSPISGFSGAFPPATTSP